MVEKVWSCGSNDNSPTVNDQCTFSPGHSDPSQEWSVQFNIAFLMGPKSTIVGRRQKKQKNIFVKTN